MGEDSNVSSMLLDAGLGYTLATGRLFCTFSDFHRWAEELAERPIMTHEFADEKLWDSLRSDFEQRITEAHGV